MTISIPKLLLAFPANPRFDNGHCQTTRGFRQVVVSPEGEIRPVQTLVNKGGIQLHRTIQTGFKGDWVVTYEYFPRVCKVSQVGDEGLIPVGNLKHLPEKVHAAIEPLLGWLTQVGLQESFLPDGFGWTNGITKSHQIRQARIRNVFKGIPEDRIEWILKESIRGDRDGFPLSWKDDAKPLPSRMDVHVDQFTGDGQEVHETTHWILFHHDRKVEYLDSLLPTSGSVQYAYGADNLYYNELGHPMPKSVNSAIRVKVQPYRDNWGDSYGIAWELYRRDKR